MSRKQHKDEFFSIEEIKEAARGREVAILEHVAGISPDILDGRNHPCPKCDGTDRFRMIDAEAGAVFCNQCFNEGNGDFIAAVRWKREVDLPEALRLIGDHLGLRPDRPAPASPKTTAKETTGTWVYTDAEGKPLYRVKRIEWTENGKPRKSFSQERHVGGQWKPGLGGVDPVPLHWPELRRRSKETVYIVEGEKCCDLLTGFGLLATTASGGSNTKINWANYLTGREVVILPDEDKPGYGYALQTADQLLKSVCAIKVIFLPGLDPKDDVADWIERGGTREELSRIVEETPDWDGKPFAYSTGDTAGKSGKGPALLEWEPFPVEVFPESLRDYIVEASAARNIDPAYVGPFVLAAVASVVGSAYRIQVKGDWEEPSIIWTALVVGSGSGKSPGLDAAVDPLRFLQRQADKRYRDSEANYENDQAVYGADLSSWKERRRKDSSLEPPEKPAAPVREAYLVDDITTESLVEVLEENPFGVCLPKDELSGWMGGFDAYRSSGSKDLSFWLSVFGGRSTQVNRKTGRKFILAETPAVSICGGIQPGMLRKILVENEHFFDSGLAARILFAMPPDRPRRWTEDEVAERTRKRYAKIFEEIIARRSSFGGADPENPCIVGFNSRAKAVFVEFYNANADERAGMESETQKAFWPKLTGYALRIALVFHLAKWIEGNTADRYIVEAGTMGEAIALVDWYKRESLRIVQSMRGEKISLDMEAGAILAAIRRNGGEITVRELQHGRRVYREAGGAEAAEKKLREMATNGLLETRWEQSPKGGRGKEVFRLPSGGNGNTTSLFPGKNHSSVTVTTENISEIAFSEPPPETTPSAPPKGPKRYRASEAAKTLLEE